jgi:prepilin-type N-terminal cleavage/methylation domain-containing protein
MRVAGYRARNTKRDKMQDAACTSSTPNSTLHAPNSKGFTLIEAIITIVIVGIISSIAALIILEGMKASSKEQNLSGVHYQARIAMERMGREIRLIRWNTTLAQADVTTMTATDLIFCDVTGKAVEFQLAGSVLNRRESATCSPLAWGGWNTLSSSGVNPLTFSYLDSTGAGGATAANLWFVDINLTDTQGSDSLQMRSRVHPRNF